MALKQLEDVTAGVATTLAMVADATGNVNACGTHQRPEKNGTLQGRHESHEEKPKQECTA